MRRRLLLGVGAFSLILIALIPFILYRISFERRLHSYRAVWDRVSDGDYDAVVISNSLDDPTGGRNEIGVRAGKLSTGHNPDCRSCSLEDFSSLTIEALFERIEMECLERRLLPICNVSYEESLGFPGRIDTYTFDEDGTYTPSIIVQEVRIVE